MKSFISLIVFLLWAGISPAKQIIGKVVDSNGAPLEFVNIYIKGTTEGTTSSEDGKFILETQLTGTVTLVASFIGYEPFSITNDISQLNNITIKLLASATDLGEVVVYAGNYSLKSASSIEQKNAVDLVTTAGSGGDLFKAIALLPGAQASTVDGRLLIRGGSSREAQTYIDGMHVLSPYTASTGNISSRGKYSPFLFEGINFSMGGYSSEYSQSLSAILPLDTKSESKHSKLGFSLMNVLIGTGGTKAWDKGSVSFNLDVTDLDLYNKIFDPEVRNKWNKPYRQYAGQSQLRFELGKNTYLKTYMAYDKTLFNLIQSDPFANASRNLDYDEDNLYLNATFNKKYENGWKLFSGVAYSLNDKNILNGLTSGDEVDDKEQELHIKAKAGKRITGLYKFEAGMEMMDKHYDQTYTDGTDYKTNIHQSITAAYLSNDFNLTSDLFLNLSSRVEHTSLDKSYAFLPRLALGYQLKNWNFSGVIGLYQQNASNENLRYNKLLSNERNIQSMLGIYYQQSGQIVRLEMYNKRYSRLPLIENGQLLSNGNGYSRGIDLFISNTRFLKYWEYTIAYSYNDTQKKEGDFPYKAAPSYVTAHNLATTLKYTNYGLRSIIAVTNKFASGRPYHDPNRNGFMNAKTSSYNSFDISYTFLAHKKLIIYASASNIFNRKNVYGYNYNTTPGPNGSFARVPIRALSNQSFYIGFFITLGKNVAYDASNF